MTSLQKPMLPRSGSFESMMDARRIRWPSPPPVPPPTASVADRASYVANLASYQEHISRVWPPQNHPPGPTSLVLVPPVQPARARQDSLTIAVDAEAVMRPVGSDAFSAFGAMALVKKLLRINAATADGVPKVEVVLTSHASGHQRRRLLAGLREAGLPVDRVLFVRDDTVHKVLKPCDAMLYLSCDPKRIRDAVAQGVAAGRILAKDDDAPAEVAPHTLQVCFDFDGVLADDVSQKCYDDNGLEAFQAFEEARRDTPMGPGPAQPLALALAKIRDALRTSGPDIPLEMRIAVITARGAVAIERMLCTLEAWDFHADDIFCLSGSDKTPFISGLKSDLYLDDNERHAERAKNVTVAVHMPTLASLGLS